jgi:hypothetical protein
MHGSFTLPGSQTYNKLGGWIGLDRSQQDWVTWGFNNDGNGGKSFDGTDFTAPVDGIYAVECMLRFDNAGTVRVLDKKLHSKVPLVPTPARVKRAGV